MEMRDKTVVGRADVAVILIFSPSSSCFYPSGQSKPSGFFFFTVHMARSQSTHYTLWFKTNKTFFLFFSPPNHYFKWGVHVVAPNYYEQEPRHFQLADVTFSSHKNSYLLRFFHRVLRRRCCKKRGCGGVAVGCWHVFIATRRISTSGFNPGL